MALLRAQGPSFSAGLDRALLDPDQRSAPGVWSLAGHSAGAASARIAEWQRAFDWSSRPDLISVAAVQGAAVGAGLQLALGTDIRVAADDARFIVAEPAWGLVPDLGGTKRLVEAIGYSRALEVCVTGRAIEAAEALRIGLVSQVVPREQLAETASRLTQALCAPDRAVAAEMKALLLGARARPQAEQEAAEREAQHRCLRALAGVATDE